MIILWDSVSGYERRLIKLIEMLSQVISKLTGLRNFGDRNIKVVTKLTETKFQVNSKLKVSEILMILIVPLRSCLSMYFRFQNHNIR